MSDMRPRDDGNRQTEGSRQRCRVIVIVCIVAWGGLLRGGGLAQDAIFTPDPVWTYVPASGLSDFFVIDIDRDGDLDLIGCEGPDRQNVLWRNQSPTAFFERFLIPRNAVNTGANNGEELAVGDVNQDGFMDVLTFRGNGDLNAIRYELTINDGGILGPSPQWASNWSAYYRWAAALADLDQDGDLDLITSTLQYYLNNGTDEVFPLSPDWMSEVPAEEKSMAVGDLDRDGDLDLVLSAANLIPLSGSIQLFLNRGPNTQDGLFPRSPDWTLTSADWLRSIALGDIDGDGDLDLVSIRYPQTVQLSLNRFDEGDQWATSIFDQSPVWIFDMESICRSTILGDVDSDGDLDLLVDGESGTLFLNQGPPNWFAVAGITASGIKSYPGDFDCDGDMDLLINDRFSLQLYLNQQPRVSGAPSQPMYLPLATWALAAGDVDNDGDVDLVSGNGGQGYLYRVDIGTDTVFPPVGEIINRFSAATRSVALIDLDLDGYLDLACGNHREPNTVYRNVSGLFETIPVWTSPDNAATTSLAAGDLNNDGRPDLLFGNSNNESRVFLNDNGAMENNPYWEGAALEVTQAVALADVDRDGDLDAIFGNLDQANTIYLNTGSNLAESAAWVSRDKLRTMSIALGDVDGDGYPDLVCGNDGQPNQLYLNNFGLLAQGLNTVPYWRSIETDSTRSIALIDVDGDGDLDLVCGNAGGQTTCYYNLGGEFPAEASWRTEVAMNTQAIALADFDRDGDIDLVCGNRGQVNTVHYGRRHPLLPWNLSQPTNQLPDNPTVLSGLRVVSTATNRYTISLTVSDAESDPVGLVPRYRYVDSPLWQPAAFDGPAGLLATSPAGETYEYSWDISRLPFDRRDVVLGVVTAPSSQRCGNILQMDAIEFGLGPLAIRRSRLEAPAELSFDRVTVGDTVSTPLAITNSGNLDLVVSDIVLPGDGSFDFDASLPLTIPPGSGQGLIFRFAPRSDVPDSQAFEVVSNDPITERVRIPIHIDVHSLEFRTILLIDGEEAPLGDALPVVVNPGEFVHIERGAVHFRSSGSAGPFTSIELNATADAFTAVIPGQFITEAGLEFFVEVENSGVNATDPPDTSGGRFLTVVVEGPSAVSTLARPSSGSEYLADRAINVDVVLPIGTEASSGQLHYRRGGGGADMSSPLTISSPYMFGSIPDSVVGERGLEYWIEVRTQTRVLTDPPVAPEVNPYRIQVTVPDLAEAETHSGGQYRMVSVPLQFKVDFTGTLEALLFDQPEFGSYDPLRWRSYRWLPGEARYTELSEEIQTAAFRPSPGRAFWLVCRDENRVRTAPITAASTPTDGPWLLELAPGWNQVGNPFAFPVAWDSVRVVGGEPRESVAEPPVAWEAGEGYQDSVRVLEPWQGYWVKNIADPARKVTLEIPAREVPMVQAVKVTAPVNGWRVTIRATAGDAVDGNTSLGCTAAAAAGWDRYDRSEPPLNPGHGVSVSFPHDDWVSRPGRYTVDMRAPVDAQGATHGHRWCFDVAKNFRDEVSGNAIALDFADVGNVPAELRISLLDRQLGRAHDLRETPQYAFHLGVCEPVTSESEARFVVLVGDGAFVDGQIDELTTPPLLTVLHQNYPNPFNPETVIRWDVAEAGRVDLKIYDLSGALVKTVQAGDLPPGGYEFVWKGEDERGRRMASGVYVYRLKTGDVVQTRRMTLVK